MFSAVPKQYYGVFQNGNEYMTQTYKKKNIQCIQETTWWGRIPFGTDEYIYKYQKYRNE